jgi:hypothetical protein
MPKLRYRGIIARPGTYKRKDGSTVTKTWEELRRAFQRTRELILTLGHPTTTDGKFRLPTTQEYLGRVLPIINEDKKVIEGDFLPHEEEWEKIPPDIRQALEEDLPLDTSTGQMSRIIDGIERDALYNHVALLVNGESPICPLGECGINVRVESDEGDITMTIEQATSTKDEEQPEEEVPQAPPATQQNITFTPEQFSKLLETLKPQPAESGEEPAKSQPDEETEPAPEPPPKQPELEPQRAFPAGDVPGEKRPDLLKDDGSVVVPIDVYLGGLEREE